MNWDMIEGLFEQNRYMAVIFFDHKGIIQYTNETYLEVLNLPRDQVVGRHILEITPHSRAYITLQTGKAKVGYEWVVNGHHTLGTALPIFGDDKDGKMIVGVFGYTVFLNIWDGKNIMDEILHNLNMYKDEIDRLHSASYTFEDIHYESKAMSDVMILAQQVAQHPLTTVLITGESGTGKELMAHAIHNASRRCQRPFVRVNCAAIPENLLESELFGYEEGAYTGARKGGKLGKFELADMGTIFLDEIAEVPLNMQSKLLFVLQEQVVERLGGVEPTKINVRVIAATNRDLEEMVKDGTFRQDLYYRLNVVHIKIPPLRYRVEDIKFITPHIIRDLSQRLNIMQREIDDRALRILCKYDWPGNVRELENVLERSLIIAEMDGARVLSSRHINIPDGKIDLSNLANDKSLKNMLEEYEKILLVQTLEKCQFDVPKAARHLKLDPSSLYRKLRKFGICVKKEYSIH
ncbi:MAG: sigma-54 interaction domain-containing protein [Syntrophomonadaceae bacterium]